MPPTTSYNRVFLSEPSPFKIHITLRRNPTKAKVYLALSSPADNRPSKADSKKKEPDL